MLFGERRNGNPKSVENIHIDVIQSIYKEKRGTNWEKKLSKANEVYLAYFYC